MDPHEDAFVARVASHARKLLPTVEAEQSVGVALLSRIGESRVAFGTLSNAFARMDHTRDQESDPDHHPSSGAALIHALNSELPDRSESLEVAGRRFIVHKIDSGTRLYATSSKRQWCLIVRAVPVSE